MPKDKGFDFGEDWRKPKKPDAPKKKAPKERKTKDGFGRTVEPGKKFGEK